MTTSIQMTATNRVAKEIMDIMTTDNFFSRWDWYQPFTNVWVFQRMWDSEEERIDDICDMETVFLDEYGVEINEFTIC